MKCPKCGSEIITETVIEYGTNGEKVYERNTVKVVPPEPSTAEKLLWLVENTEGTIEYYKDNYMTIVIWRDDFSDYKRFRGEYKEAIQQAYKWAKEARDE